jgi:uronate dehydrogenase
VDRRRRSGLDVVMSQPQTILLTGAAGVVGSAVRPLLAERYRTLISTDVRRIEPSAENERIVQGDLRDARFADRVTAGVDGVVHLAGLVGPDFQYDEVMEVNVDAAHHLLRAAAERNIKQFVYASSHHAVGFLPRGAAIDARTPHRPDSFYGMSKAIGETIATYYADKYGLNVLSIRIGYVGETVIDERRLHTWCSARDLVQLIAIGLERDDLGYRVVYGVSDTPDPFFDNSAATALGYRPADRALDHLADESIATERPDRALLENRLVGGYFGANGFRGDADRFAALADEENAAHRQP